LPQTTDRLVTRRPRSSILFPQLNSGPYLSGWRGAFGIAEATGHDADNGVGSIIDLHALSQDAGIATKRLPPHRIAQYDRPGIFVRAEIRSFREEAAPQRRLHTEHREEIAADLLALYFERSRFALKIIASEHSR
jgi:hypothetical protein